MQYVRTYRFFRASRRISQLSWVLDLAVMRLRVNQRQTNQGSAFCASLIQLNIHVGHPAVSEHDFDGIQCVQFNSTAHLGSLGEAWPTRLRLRFSCCPGSCVVLLGSSRMTNLVCALLTETTLRNLNTTTKPSAHFSSPHPATDALPSNSLWSRQERAGNVNPRLSLNCCASPSAPAGSATIRTCSRRPNSTQHCLPHLAHTQHTLLSIQDGAGIAPSSVAIRLSHPCRTQSACDPRHGIDSSERLRWEPLSQPDVWWEQWTSTGTGVTLCTLWTALVIGERAASSRG